jgi:hypothetical protein
MKGKMMFGGQEIEISEILYFRKCFSENSALICLATSEAIYSEEIKKTEIDARVEEICAQGNFLFFGQHFLAIEKIVYLAFLPGTKQEKENFIINAFILGTDLKFYETFQQKINTEKRQTELITLGNLEKNGIFFDGDFLVKKYIKTYYPGPGDVVNIDMKYDLFSKKYFDESEAQEAFEKLILELK